MRSEILVKGRLACARNAVVSEICRACSAVVTAKKGGLPPDWFDLCKEYFGGKYGNDIYEIMFEKRLVTMMDRCFILQK